MDVTTTATEDDPDMLGSIAATLLALAVLAEQAARRSRPVRCFVLWILRYAEAVALEFVAETTGKLLVAPPTVRNGSDAADAIRLARRLRALARALKDVSRAFLRFNRKRVRRDVDRDPSRLSADRILAVRDRLAGVATDILGLALSGLNRLANWPAAPPDTS